MANNQEDNWCKLEIVEENPYTPQKSAKTIERDRRIRECTEKLKNGVIDAKTFLNEVTYFEGEEGSSFKNPAMGKFNIFWRIKTNN